MRKNMQKSPLKKETPCYCTQNLDVCKWSLRIIGCWFFFFFSYWTTRKHCVRVAPEVCDRGGSMSKYDVTIRQGWYCIITKPLSVAVRLSIWNQSTFYRLSSSCRTAWLIWLMHIDMNGPALYNWRFLFLFFSNVSTIVSL